MADALSIVEFQALSCDYDDNFDLILEEIGVDSVLSGVVVKKKDGVTEC